MSLRELRNRFPLVDIWCDWAPVNEDGSQRRVYYYKTLSGGVTECVDIVDLFEKLENENCISGALNRS